ncbi:PHP domain-containing protein [candidate division WOR-3 bacterium]|nr:PHP domain-containing protein [candidate division WOR-3 bacterium]
MLSKLNLHLHTTCSDGKDEPKIIALKAFKCGLKTIAITDHDTIEGYYPAKIMGNEYSLEVISGVELSLEAGEKATCHLLGYLFDPDNSALKKALEKISASRERRNREILKKLEKDGFSLDYEELAQKSGKKKNLGRLHIAAAMVSVGFVKNYHEAFAKYLAKGRRAYLPRYRLEIGEGIEVIHSAGGVACLAHPGEGYPSKTEYERILFKLIDSGLDGIEVYYPSHTHEQIHEFSRQARDYGLVMTAGTDYHGISGRDLLKFDYDIDYNILEKLKEKGGVYARSRPAENSGSYKNIEDNRMDR